MRTFPFTARRCAPALAAFIALGATGCGDPIFVLGDTPGEVRIVAGRADSIGTRVDSVATRTRFSAVSAVAFDDQSLLLYIADRGAVRQLNGISTNVARLFSVTSAGRLELVLDTGGCASTTTCLLQPVSMTFMDGSLIIADATGHRVVRFDTDSRTFVTIAGTGAATPATAGQAAASSPMNAPAGVVAGPAGLYVSERGANRVWLIGTDGVLTQIAGGGASAITASPAPATAARLIEPSGLALRDSLLYIADMGAHAVEVVNLETGTIRRVAGDGFAGFTGDVGPATAARLNSPRDVSIDAAGSLLYIADTGNHRIRALHLATGTISTFAGTGATAYNGDRLAAASTALSNPVDLAGSSRPFLFIVDQGHAIVRRASLGF